MAASSQTFQQTWRIGRRVQEVAPPHRKGAIKARQGTGPNAVITVALDGRPPASFRPAQLTPL
ncbi:MAG TPA: hypothetical protein VGS06_36175 [Streptosporangiaceae bacterium]|nr:hypothetical protein [Streptosporangiaceae bacterium]